MKKALIFVSCLMLARPAVGESVAVGKLKLQESSRHVRIAVSLNGHPVPDAIVDFCAADKPCISTSANKNGVALSPRLSDGNYMVTAALEDVSGGDLYLHISRKGKTSFSIDLTEAFRAQQDYLSAADKLPIHETLEVFQGLLRDPSGAVIPRANIKIVRRGSENHTIIQRVKTDQNGRFSAALQDGIYVAFFSCQGFRTEIVPFAIAPQGSKELAVKLEVGQSTESVRVAAKQ